MLQLSTILVAALLLLAHPGHGQMYTKPLPGGTPGSAFGFAVANAGDTDKDGTDDFLVGAPREGQPGERKGAIYLFSGAKNAKEPKLLRYLLGDQIDSGFGHAVAKGGDFDGDGWNDLLVGAPHLDTEEFTNAGCAYAISGRDGKVLHRVQGTGVGDGSGWSLVTISDVDGDNRADFAVGMPFRANNRQADCGAVVIVSGRTGKELRTVLGKTPGARFGWSLANVGDLTGDGCDEILVGIEGDRRRMNSTGTAMVLSAKTGKNLRELRAGDEDDYFGTSVGSAGDFDGDNDPDLVVGAFNAKAKDGTRGGAAYVFSSATGKLLTKLVSDTPHEHFGAAVGGVGDLDGDQRSEIAVGGPHVNDGGPGTVRIYSSRDSGLMHTLVGQGNGIRFGACFATIPDQDGDGIADLLVGSPEKTPNGEAGIVYLPKQTPKAK